MKGGVVLQGEARSSTDCPGIVEMCFRSDVTTKAEWKRVREAGRTAGLALYRILSRKSRPNQQAPERKKVPGSDEGSALLLSSSPSSQMHLKARKVLSKEKKKKIHKLKKGRKAQTHSQLLFHSLAAKRKTDKTPAAAALQCHCRRSAKSHPEKQGNNQ